MSVGLTLQDLRDHEIAHTFFTHGTALYERFWGDQHVQTAIGCAWTRNRFRDPESCQTHRSLPHPFPCVLPPLV